LSFSSVAVNGTQQKACGRSSKGVSKWQQHHDHPSAIDWQQLAVSGNCGKQPQEGLDGWKSAAPLQVQTTTDVSGGSQQGCSSPAVTHLECTIAPDLGWPLLLCCAGPWRSLLL
jgi:hypothetical protein